MYGDNHCSHLASVSQNTATVTYIKYWQFEWEDYGRDKTFYREAAWPHDCIRVMISDQEYYVNDLTTLAFVQGKDLREELVPLKQQLDKEEKDCQAWTRNQMTVMGIMDSYFNYKSMAGISAHRSPLTGRMTDPGPKAYTQCEEQTAQRRVLNIIGDKK